MSATKRKFNALLQGLSDSRTGLEDGSSAYDALLQKRRRLGFPASTAPKFDSQTNSPTDLAASLSQKRRAQQQADKEKQTKKPAVRYCPTDRDELLRRLETFQDITRWTSKPDRISEFEWTKRGWLCQAKETVRCVLCSKELVVKLSRANKSTEETQNDDEATASTTEALVDKYAELIVSGHQEECLWRKRGCDDSLLRLHLANASSARSALRQRYDELLTRTDHLPYDFNLRIPTELNTSTVLNTLPSDFFAPASSSTGDKPAESNTVAITLALCGWQGLPDARMGSIANSISCRTCLRRLGLWMFKSKEVDSSGNVVVPAPMEHLDVVREHRFFCPWRNPATQASSSIDADAATSVPAWEVLVQTLRNEAHLRKTYGHSGSSQSKDAEETGETTVGAADLEEGDDEEQKAKDKERWARLKKIKSLFDIKGGKGRSRSRPGTSHSTKSVAHKQA